MGGTKKDVTSSHQSCVLISLIHASFLLYIIFLKLPLGIFYFCVSANTGPYQLVLILLTPNDLTVHLITAI